MKFINKLLDRFIGVPPSPQERAIDMFNSDQVYGRITTAEARPTERMRRGYTSE